MVIRCINPYYNIQFAHDWSKNLISMQWLHCSATVSVLFFPIFVPVLCICILTILYSVTTVESTLSKCYTSTLDQVNTKHCDKEEEGEGRKRERRRGEKMSYNGAVKALCNAWILAHLEQSIYTTIFCTDTMYKNIDGVLFTRVQCLHFVLVALWRLITLQAPR